MTERLISADSHVRVSHDQIKSFMPAKYHAVYDEAASEHENRMKTGAGAANQAGAKPKDKASTANSAFSRPSYFDPTERLKDMDTDGVDVEVLYSEVSAFRYLSKIKDGGVGPALRAFNDCIHAFADVDPKRLVMSYQVPIHDIELAMAEVERVVGMGAKSLQLPVFPSELGQLDYYHDRYAPLLSLIQETGLPIALHIGLKTTLSELADRDPTPLKGIMVSMTPLMTAESFGMWTMTGLLERFPDLQLVFVEPGIAWVAWYMEMVDDMVTRQGYEYPGTTMLPSEYMRRNMNFTFIDEKLGVERMRDYIGVENLMWSTDFPHPVTSWPNSRAVVDKQFAGVPKDEREAMLSGNAMRIWNLS
ncbi:amidohydrolase family protein [Blastococcus sp. URHD0036]|uniref:amidohydrolase family protein n=1 Tax=Blastococcus sp. URHD0036 TaxID=1380356 RepID=UPI00068AA326|nr:amidohydrolase family protein [Blastococcus sp. URHD0036]